MELTSMKNSKSSDTDSPKAVDMGDEEYPYGLRLSLDDANVDSLDLANCKVGDEVMIMAKAKIVSKSEYEDEGEGKNKSVSLQITDMNVDKGSDNKPRAEKLYDK